MKITVDDWHFRDRQQKTLVVDVFLDNGQHALMEINPMLSEAATDHGVPEMIVFSELPGEKVTTDDCPARWISRPPSRDCPWSNVELPQALVTQIQDHLGASPVA